MNLVAYYTAHHGKQSLARVRYNDGTHARTWSAVTRLVRGMPLSVTPLWGGLSNDGGGRWVETMGSGGGGGRCDIVWLIALKDGRPARTAGVPEMEIKFGSTWLGTGGGGIPCIIGGGTSVLTGRGIVGASVLTVSPRWRSVLSWPIDFTGATFWVSENIIKNFSLLLATPADDKCKLFSWQHFLQVISKSTGKHKILTMALIYLLNIALKAMSSDHKVKADFSHSLW